MPRLENTPLCTKTIQDCIIVCRNQESAYAYFAETWIDSLDKTLTYGFTIYSGHEKSGFVVRVRTRLNGEALDNGFYMRTLPIINSSCVVKVLDLALPANGPPFS